MKILVPIKRAVDYNVRIRVKSDGTGVETSGVKMSVNPFCEIAVEEALRIKEAGNATEIVPVTIGTAKAEEQLRSALAMGADRAIHVVTEDDVQPLQVAKILAAIAKEEDAGLVLMGKQAIDDDSNQVGQMMAAILGWAQATFASKIELSGSTAKVDREVDAGIETIDVDLPAVITSDLRLNEPRFIKLPDIMKAKRKPLDKKELGDYNVGDVPKLTVTKTAPPPARAAGKMVKDVAELVSELKDKGLV